jgi:hypothetical protein
MREKKPRSTSAQRLRWPHAPAIRKITLGLLLLSKRGSNLTAVVLADLDVALRGYCDPIVFGAAVDGSIYAVARKSVGALVEEHGLGVVPRTDLTAPVEHIVVRWHAGKLDSLLVASESLIGSYVQPHPEGVLLVGSRCQWNPAGPEHNAIVIDGTGRIVRRMTLGDGIEDVRVSPNGTIWVSYFDEGVLGTNGWSDPGPTAIGAAGLVAFTPEGELRRGYQPVEAGTDDILDAYALNVVGDDDVWVYFYVDFPIVNLREGGYLVWEQCVAGARALAVRGEQVLLLGDYAEPDLAHVLKLGGAQDSQLLETRRLVDERGQSLGDARCFGVGDRLYLLRNRQVLVASEW